MAGSSSDVNMVRVTNEEFLKKAQSLTPSLHETLVTPTALVNVEKGGKVTRRGDADSLSGIELKKGDSVILDFGDHQVGYLSLKMKTVGSPQDAPVYIRLKFAERPGELLENSADYDGWISSSWIQEEFIHLDVLPVTLEMPRRYAFRYVEIYTMDVSIKFQLVIEEAVCRSVSSAASEPEPLVSSDPRMQQMDKVSIRTLHNCMQSVFEDGPKRDRRLWLGDLRLQALANYATFRQNDLVKRCLYLFAAQTRDDGAIGACLFIEPVHLVDDTFLFDYSLFYVAALRDYLKATGDRETAEELWPSAYRQIELAGKQLDERGVVIDGGDAFWCFVDWKEGLNKQASAQAIYVFCINAGIELAEMLDLKEQKKILEEKRDHAVEAALNYLYDEKEQLFVSGPDRQISYASQVWMVMADIVSGEDGAALLKRVSELNPPYGMVTPYMYHHYVEALIKCGEKEKALESMEGYWGGMLDQGADTFWELYNPENPTESPYGSDMVNSYCHAWSCTPTYILRELLKD
ncbi:MAG: cellobiose phosphorylase [Candidatus Limivivens sp.]|nr:cellobiose phosphorylase [Candidatus Limivivens sp.]